jgi:integrase
MRGHIKKRGTWQYTLELGLRPLQRCPACRKRYWVEKERLKRCPRCQGPLEDAEERRQEFHTGYASKKEAENDLAQAIVALSTGAYVLNSKLPFSEYLRDEWLPSVRPTIRSTTYLSYEGHVERHIIPSLGSTTLQQLSASQLNAFYARLLSGSAAGSTRPLAPGTVRRVHATLHRALRDAVRWNRISRSPADGADPPRLGGAPEMKVWKATELKAFLTFEKDSPFYPLWLLLATTGARRGEALGLAWEDVDLDAGRIAIRRTLVVIGYDTEVSEPKTKKGRRLLTLDPATAAVLRQHREHQEAQHVAAGGALLETDYVFADADGHPYHPEFISKRFRRASKRAGLPPIRLHDLRHTYATVALAAGIHPKVVSERLGHANIGITLDTYSHVLPGLSEEAAARVAALVVPD